MSGLRPAGKPRGADVIAMLNDRSFYQPRRAVEAIKISAIKQGADRRVVRVDDITRVADSMAKIGLKTPITVRRLDNGFGLVTGAHRLAAAKKLGWKEIDAFVSKFESDVDARLWEIAENLHRAELTALERANHIAEWVRLTDKGAQIAHPLGGVQPEDRGISKASKELGKDRAEIQRSIKIASLTSEAKKVAVEVGLDDNNSALLKAAKQDPRLQGESLAKFAADKAAQRDSMAGATVEDRRAAKRLAEKEHLLADKDGFLAQPYTRPADKYFAAQEAKLGPIARVPLTKEMRTDITGARASILAAAKRINQYGIAEIATAIAAAVEVIDRYLA
jgi:ParB/RepB/Spo0J family partition protein